MTSKTIALRQPVAANAAAPAAVTNPIAAGLQGRDLCSMRDLSSAEVECILGTALQIKAQPRLYRHALESRQLVMFFEKESLRTRLTFETGINTLGGSAIFVDQTSSRLGQRESLYDV